MQPCNRLPEPHGQSVIATMWRMQLGMGANACKISLSQIILMADLVEGGEHVALALDGTLAQGHKHVALLGEALDDCITDMHAAGEAVALHAAGHIDSVTQETVARALHANHTSIRWPTVQTCRQRVGLWCTVRSGV